jgi:hypothetical protein
MDKQKIIRAIVEQLEKDLVSLKAAALATYDAATNEESKPENEYDTRGLEASYLAGAQAKRVADVEELIYIFKDLKIKNYQATEAISSTALVEVSLNGKTSMVFIIPKGGGLLLQAEGHSIQTVTPSSPLGEALMGLTCGDTASVETGNKVRDYKILAVH